MKIKELLLLVMATVWSLSANNELIRAIKNGNIDGVEKVLKNGVNVNEQEQGSGTTALIEAVKFQKHNVVQFLIKSKAKLDIADKTTYTALHHAINQANENIVTMLLKAGALKTIDFYPILPDHKLAKLL